MRSGVRIRPAVLADIPDLVRVAEDAVIPPGRGGLSAERAVQNRGERYTALLGAPDRVVLVAADEGSDAVVGVLIATEDEVGALIPVRALVVGHLVVALRHRRRGVGRELLGALVRHADDRGVEQVVVAATSGDREANRYLARLGFAPLVVRRIAPTATLRRSLGMGDLVERAAMRRRRGMRGVLPGGRVTPRGA